MTTTLTIRMDESLKADAEAFFEEIGMNLTTAITCYFKKCIAVGEIPFRLGRRNLHDRLAALKLEADEAAANPAAPRCTDPEKLHEFLFS